MEGNSNFGGPDEPLNFHFPIGGIGVTIQLERGHSLDDHFFHEEGGLM